MEQTPGYRMTASNTGVTTLSTSLRGMSRLVPPPPEISIWDKFPWEAPIPQQPVTTPSYRPPIGRGKRLKAALQMRSPVPQVPQVAPAIHQLPPLSRGQPATPYQQVVQPPSKTLGLRVTFDDRDDRQPPASPIFHREDELLTGDNAVGVEGERANLMVSSPRGCDGSDEGASI